MRQGVWKGGSGNAVGAPFFIIRSAIQTANAALVSRFNGQAVYDTDLDITWLADANYAKTSSVSADGLLSRTDTQSWTLRSIRRIISASITGACQPHWNPLHLLDPSDRKPALRLRLHRQRNGAPD